MASKLGLGFDNKSSVKLPMIGEGVSLVSPPPSARLPSLSEQAATWAQDVRQR